MGGRALYVLDAEEQMNIVIMPEHEARIDKFSQDVMMHKVGTTFFIYVERYYQCQFLTCKVSSNQIVSRVEELLHNYFYGLPVTIQSLSAVVAVVYFAGALHLSSDYLNHRLKVLISQSPQGLIIREVVNHAKEQLSAIYLTIMRLPNISLRT